MLFDLTVLPPVTELRGSEPGFDPLFASDADYAAYAATLAYDISPSTDDCPFFFDRVPLIGWIAHRIGLPAPAWAASELPLGSRTLLIAIAVTSINAVLLIAAPLLLRSRRTNRQDPIERGHLRWIAYFACLGVGYIAVEIVLIQRFHLFLGKPSHALSVVLFSMLSSSAVGALVADRFGDSLRALSGMLGVAIVAIAGLALAAGPVVAWAGGASEPVRIAVAIAMVAPVGFVMGMPFPTGLRRVARLSPALVSWAWAVNGAMSVLGSVLAVIVSMTSGFTASMMLGWLSYAVALIVVLRLQRDE